MKASACQKIFKTNLKNIALLSQLADTVQYEVDDLFTNGVVTAGVVVGGILLTSDQLLGVEQLTVRAGTNLICEND